MNEREELAALRRLAELEAKAAKGAPQTEKFDPSEGGGTLQFGPFDTGIKTPQAVERTLAGVGKTFADLGTGMRQLGARGLDFVAPRNGQSRLDEVRADVSETRRLDAPLMNTTAGKVGNIGGAIALAAPTALIPGANTVTGSALVGAGLGLLQPTVSNSEAALNVGLGAAGGAIGQRMANALGNYAQNTAQRLTQGQQQAAQAGNALGMRLTPGKASGSRALQRVEAALESNPLTAGGFDAIKEGNERVMARAAANAIGETADELSAPVLARADQRLGAVFDSVADATPVQLDPQTFGPRLRQILRDSEGLLNNNGNLANNGLWQRLDDFVNNRGGATREQLRALSSNLGKAARNNMTSANGDRELGAALLRTQDIVEDAIQGTLSAGERAAYNEARNQYRNLVMLTSRTGIVNPSSGNVNGRTLANALMQRDRGGFTMGRNASDMYEAARFTQAFPDIVGNSGTATRSMGPADYLTGIPGALATRLYLSAPVTAAAAAGAGAAGIGARLAAPPANALAMPIGALSGTGLAQWLQQ